MALLNRLPASRGVRIGAVGVLLATLSGCVLYDALRPSEKRFAFGHREHVVEQGLACEDCHAPNANGEPGLPVLAQCNLCHTDLDATKPDERKIATLFADGRLVRSNAALTSDLRFAHPKHAEAFECSACHVGMEQNDDVLEAARPSMASCVQCHEERNAPSECSTCHTTLREDVAPRTHDGLWRKRHGGTVCSRSEASVDQCSTCHEESDCSSCHLEQAPENHTDYWRSRAHGINASLDRASCAVCHRDDSCVRCHQTSRPTSHVGNWGAPLDRHCVGCHFPVEEEGCNVCHHGTPSHALAPPKPGDHSAGMNCRMCHGVGQPLPHVDNGDNCNLCHH